MKHFFTILSHEVRMLLVSPSTYIAAVMFLGLMGFIFTGILEKYSSAPQDVSPAIAFFYLFWIPVFFMVPLLTMKCLAEERRLGTIETLLTTPVTTTEVVLGKYAAAYLLYASFWASTYGFFTILRRFAGDARLLDPGPIIGGYVFIAVSGLLFVAVGVLASSLSKNQAVAGILSFSLLFALIIGSRFLAGAPWLDREGLSPLKAAIEYGQIFNHYEDFTRGVVDTRELLFYVSGTALALIFSILSVEARVLKVESGPEPPFMSAQDNFRTVRWLRTINLILQAILFLTLVVGLNYVAHNHDWRFDLTRFRRYSLSPETLSYLKDLPRPVRIIVTANEEAAGSGIHADSPEIRGLLAEYVYATETSRDGPISVDYVDVYADRRKVENYGIVQPDIILLICGDKRQALTVNELYHFQNKVPKAFVGEAAVTAAILDVSSPERKKIYFLVGHGELPGDADPARGISIALDELRVRNFAVDTLELDRARRIPDDASLIVSVSPLTPYSRREQELLRQYLGAGAGRLILFLAPGTHSGLEDLLLDWNVMVDDDLIYDTPGSDNMTEDGDLIINAIQPHPITQTLFDYKMVLRVGSARSVRPLPGSPPGGGLTVVTLAATSKTAWGEVSYRQRGPQSFTPGVDIKGLPQLDPPDRLGIAVASERTAVRGNLPFSVPVGRLVVFGTGDLISNARITNPGAEAIFLGAVNWTVGRDQQISVPPRPVERFQLSLGAGELARMRYTLMLALPGAAAILGLIVYWTRRS